jgi:hypothetical protein
MMMNNTLGRWIFAALLAGLVLLGSTHNFQASAQESAITSITSPTEGETVTGLITVTGAVDFEDFLKYEVFLKSGDQLAWAATVYAPVVNGNLARIDTRTYLDGVYQLVIRRVNPDSNYTDVVGPTISIENGLGSPLPHPEIESSYLYAPEGAALARVKNCSGNNLEFDYVSPDGFCSAGNLWIMPKAEDSPVCPSEDILLTPCEYRGSAIGQGEERGATYSFVAEAGKIYQIDYPGGGQLYIGEIPGDERASSDTGGLTSSIPTQPQTAAQPTPVPSNQSNVTTTKAGPVVEPDVLPVSGQGQASNLTFIVGGISLILLLIGGGVIAVRNRRVTT